MSISKDDVNNVALIFFSKKLDKVFIILADELGHHIPRFLKIQIYTYKNNNTSSMNDTKIH